ncbi:MAG: MFS transporter [Planctomycetes bacterium]|nr:MFS transporter [Planctomycetota bacterium]
MSKPTNIRWLIIALLVCHAFMGHFSRVSMSVVGSERFIGPGKLSEQQMGFIYSTFLIVYTIGMLPGGYLIDRVGPRWAMGGMAIGLSIWVTLTGMLGWCGLSIAAMFIPLLLIRAAAGITGVPLHPGAARAVSLWIPIRQRSLANGLVNTGALVGIALTFPLFGWLIDQVDWQWAFVICGIGLLFLGVTWLALSADSAANHRWANAAESELIHGGTPIPARTRATFGEFLALFGNRSMVLLTLSYGMLGYLQYLFFYWIEYYFKNEFKLPSSESRSAAFTVTMAMGVGMAVGGWVADWLCRKLGQSMGCRVMAISFMSLCAVFALLGVSSREPREVVWCFSVAMGALGMCEGIFWTMAPALEPRNGGLACALLNTGGNGIGLLAPIFTPLIGQALGWSAAIQVACVLCAIGGLLWFGIRSRSSDRPSRPTE